MFKFSALALIVAVPCLAHADTFRNFLNQSQDQLKSAEGTYIYVTAQNYESGDVGDNQTNTAEQIQVTVGAPEYGMNAISAHATIIQNCVSGEFGWKISKPDLDVDLTPNTDGSSVSFSGQFPGVDMVHSAVHGGEWINCQPQIAVVIGLSNAPQAWQTDPVTKSHNFNLENF